MNFRLGTDFEIAMKDEGILRLRRRDPSAERLNALPSLNLHVP